MILSIDTMANEHKMTLQHERSYSISLGTDIYGNIQRIDNTLANIEKLKTESEERLKSIKSQFEVAKEDVKKEFPKEKELSEKLQRLSALDALLNMDKRHSDAIDITPDEGDLPKKKNKDIER